MRRAKSLILLFHRVATLDRDPLLLAVSPENFAAQIQVLERAARMVRLEELFEPSSERRIALTFDDGYADNFSTAGPLLARRGVPATVFVCSSVLDDRSGLWWDRLERLLFTGRFARRHIEITLPGGRLGIDLGSRVARDRAFAALHSRLRPMTPAEITRALDELEQSLVVPLDPVTDLMATESQLADAHQQGISIGGHGTTHARLSSLDPATQLEEIANGRERLRAISGADVDAFAYPYGGAADFTEESIQCVQESGYSFACANEPGGVRSGDDRWRLPRHLVRDWEAGELEQKIEAWFDG